MTEGGLLAILRTTVQDDMKKTVPRKRMLEHGGRYKATRLSIHFEHPPYWESFITRSMSHDPTRGCMDPDQLPMSGSATSLRDIMHVNISRQNYKPQSFSLYFYLAHLVHPLELLYDDDDDDEDDDDDDENNDDDDDDDVGEEERQEASGEERKEVSGGVSRKLTRKQAESKMEEAQADGTWAGFVLWDAAIVLAEFLLKNDTQPWLRRGARVVELGCGLGLPGFVCGLMGCTVALTDRGVVAELCEENIVYVQSQGKGDNINNDNNDNNDNNNNNNNNDNNDNNDEDEGQCEGFDVFASDLEWTSPDSVQRVVDRLGGPPDLVIGTDVIFLPLYGQSNPLLEVLLSLCKEGCTVLLSCERRPKDGLETFFKNADCDFVSKVVEVNGNVVVIEMRRR